jgi:hypothetical protein
LVIDKDKEEIRFRGGGAEAEERQREGGEGNGKDFHRDGYSGLPVFVAKRCLRLFPSLALVLTCVII